MIKFLKENNINFTKNFCLKNVTTIKGIERCKYYIEVDNYYQLYNLLDYIKLNNLKYLIIGNGSKVVFINNYKGIIISLKKLNKIYKNIDTYEVDAGVLLPNLINYIKKDNYGGIEELIGIPCSIGGGLVNNVSAHNVELSKFLIKVMVYEDNKIKEINKNDIIFSYRNSSLKNKIILKAYFKFVNKDKEIIENKIKEYKEYRKNNQVISLPNIGSIFKNINDIKAYKIIKDCNLENIKFKNISLSKKHLNFLEIKGTCKGKNVYKFIKKIQKKVYFLKKIKLKTEIIFIKS